MPGVFVLGKQLTGGTRAAAHLQEEATQKYPLLTKNQQSLEGRKTETVMLERYSKRSGNFKL